MGDRHGGCFARRGRALNPHRPQVDTHRAVGFAIAPRFSDAAGWWAGFAPRENALLGEGLPTRRTSKRFVPRRNTPHGEGLPTRRTSERICPTREGSPRRRPPDTAHERKDLPRARALPTAKASRYSARAKGFAPHENAPHGEGLPTRRTSERICPRRNTPRGEGLPTRRTSERICPTGGRVHPACRRTAGRSRPTNSRKNTPSAGSHPQHAAAAEFIHQKK